ncbi:MAG: CDF family Co(II)/Ni(II) efflux transporter DmeF [Candidatus Marinimicrobia bacterium]|nr:CDF family Co(II)/Ni(II) efflux transporter DmeF [Candidatus Neomarinimicrobiota bacterium]
MHYSPPQHHKATLPTVENNLANESKTWRVFVLTFIMMIVEISAALATGSMALLADGWHMGTHAAAFGITIFAYRYARRNLSSKRFSFGPGKVTTLGGFASAVALAVVALFMITESVERFFNPMNIRFNEAIVVAVIGLAVNVVSAILLMGSSLKDHTHSHEHSDHNLRSAYFHVLADALTSVLAISALVMGKYLGWQFMDPMMGIVGALVILKWSQGLLSSSADVLLDKAAGGKLELQIRNLLEKDNTTKVANLKMWYVAPDKIAAAICLTNPHPVSIDAYQKLLAETPELIFSSIETHSIDHQH